MSFRTMRVDRADAPGRRLERIDASAFSERTIQDLLFHNPDLLSVDSAGEADRLIPVAQELGVGGEKIDNLYVDATGRLTIVETKLARNPESHRHVVPQIIGDAASLSKWSYEELDAAVRAATGGRDLNAIVRERVPDEGALLRFQRRLSERLPTADFELLIVGDRIQQRAIRLVDAIAAAPTLRFRLSLIELAIYSADGEGGWPWTVVPALVERVIEHERFVVRIEHAGPSRPTVSVEVGSKSTGETETGGGRGRVGDAETFFTSPDLPPKFGEIFRERTQRWVAAGGTVSPTAKSFRWQFGPSSAEQYPLIAHTNDVQINRTADDVPGLSAAAFAKYADAIRKVPAAASALERQKFSVPLNEVTAEQLRAFLDATLALADDLERRD